MDNSEQAFCNHFDACALKAQELAVQLGKLQSMALALEGGRDTVIYERITDWFLAVNDDIAEPMIEVADKMADQDMLS